jgi:ribonuclease Z
MRRVLLSLLAMLAALGGAAWFAVLHVPSVETWLYRRAASLATRGSGPDLGNANTLSVLLVGTGSPLPDAGRAGPSTLISADGRLYLVDAGIDSARNLMLWRVPLDKIDGILITHFHSDHIAELGEIRLQTWVAGRKTPLPVYGPPGIEQVAEGFNEAYGLDAGYRTRHHGSAFLPPEAVALVAKPVLLTNGVSAPVFSRDGFAITAIRVHHDPATPAYGYRFDFRGRSVVVSGDTTPDEDLARAAKGADVLVHEGLSPLMVGILRDALVANGHPRAAKIMHDIPGYHSSPVEAARIANQANVKLLVFTHLLPILPNASAQALFLDGVDQERPSGVALGHDGLLVRLPGGSKDVEQASVN